MPNNASRDHPNRDQPPNNGVRRKMNRRILIYLIFSVATAAAALAILVEVINPHSSLLHNGAFARSIAILCVIPLWLWLCGKEKSKLKACGCAVLGFVSSIYFIYAINALHQDNLYKKQVDDSRTLLP